MPARLAVFGHAAAVEPAGGPARARRASRRARVPALPLTGALGSSWRLRRRAWTARRALARPYGASGDQRAARVVGPRRARAPARPELTAERRPAGRRQRRHEPPPRPARPPGRHAPGADPDGRPREPGDSSSKLRFNRLMLNECVPAARIGKPLPWLYEGLLRLAPTLGARVGRAAAVAEVRGAQRLAGICSRSSLEPSGRELPAVLGGGCAPLGASWAQRRGRGSLEMRAGDRSLIVANLRSLHSKSNCQKHYSRTKAPVENSPFAFT